MADAPGDFDAQAIYDEVSKDYEDASRPFWQYLSARTVERLDLKAGETVLDVPLARPDSGRLAVTVFGEHVFDPIREAFVGIVGDVAPELEVIEPWRRTEDASVVRGIFEAARVDDFAITTEDERLPLPSPDDWWRMVMGSALRHTVTALGEERAATVRARCDAYIRDHGVHEIVIRGHHVLARR